MCVHSAHFKPSLQNKLMSGCLHGPSQETICSFHQPFFVSVLLCLSWFPSIHLSFNSSLPPALYGHLPVEATVTWRDTCWQAARQGSHCSKAVCLTGDSVTVPRDSGRPPQGTHLCDSLKHWEGFVFYRTVNTRGASRGNVRAGIIHSGPQI